MRKAVPREGRAAGPNTSLLGTHPARLAHLRMMRPATEVYAASPLPSRTRGTLWPATQTIIARHWPYALLLNELRGLWTVERAAHILGLL